MLNWQLWLKREYYSKLASVMYNLNESQKVLIKILYYSFCHIKKSTEKSIMSITSEDFKSCIFFSEICFISIDCDIKCYLQKSSIDGTTTTIN